MRIFVFEYITGGGLAGRPMLPGLAREGDLMLRSLAEDLLQIPSVDVVTCRDTRLPEPDLPVRLEWVDGPRDLSRAWSAGVRGCDATWPIAPETDGRLERLSAAVVQWGGILLGSRPEGVRLAASKLATARLLESRGLRVVETWRVGDLPPPPEGCWVLKPDEGVGCVGTRLLRGGDSLEEVLANLAAPLDWVLQPYLPGDAASLSLLVGDGNCRLLACNRQRVALEDDGFVLLGCEVNGLQGDWSYYESLGREVAEAIPGLWGYVGVDLILTDEGPVILEVNPRLTSCYAGLSRSLGANVASMVLDLAGGQSAVVADTWRAPRPVDVDLEHCRVF